LVALLLGITGLGLFILMFFRVTNEEQQHNNRPIRRIGSRRNAPVPFDRDQRRQGFQNPKPQQRGMEDQVLVTNAAFTIIDTVNYVARYGRRDFATLNSVATTGKLEGFKNPLDIITSELNASTVRSLFRVIPDPVIVHFRNYIFY